MNPKKIRFPAEDDVIRQLKAGDPVLLSGTLLTGRDAAHKRLISRLEEGLPLPVELRGQFLYYVGPAPARPGCVSGSAGPTSSYRMDPYTPQLLALGLKGMIGKGLRSNAVIEAMVRHGAVYLAATGGAAALLASCIVKSEVIAYEDLGPEAIRRLEVVDFPATVAIDTQGGNLYVDGPACYRRSNNRMEDMI